jgi:predicted O-linked N-acetylglucosamine transferase (SPINDLY family)
VNRKQRRAAAKHGKQPVLAPSFHDQSSRFAELLSTAFQHHQAGKLDEAERGYRQILKTYPSAFSARHLLGITHYQRGDYEEAIYEIDLVLRLKPTEPSAHSDRGNALQGLGRLDEALVSYDRAIALKPDYAEALYNRGTALQGLKRLDEALASYDRAIALKADYADAFNNRSNVLQELKRLDEALASLDRAIALRPDYAELFNNRGSVLQELKRSDEALVSYDRAIALKPDYAEAFINKAGALQELGKLDDAIACYRQALHLKPKYAEAHRNLGIALKDQYKLDDAVVEFQRALALKPAFEVYSNLGATLQLQGKLDEAITHYQHSLTFNPDYMAAYSNLLFCLIYDERLTADQLFAAHQQWNIRYGRNAPRRMSYANKRSAERRLKVGYVSGDFRRHSVAYFFAPLLSAHDHEAVEIFCYAEVRRADAITERFKTLADHWRVTVGLSDEAVAAQIAADDIDILVDLAGHTAANRLPMFARKPAPIQVTWLGYPHSTGLSAIDYRLVDAVTDPEDDVLSIASEKLVRLDGTFLCYEPPNYAPSPLPPPSLESGAITFGSFNNPNKYSAVTIDAWAKLLSRVPEARLLLKGLPFADASTRALYQARLSDRGVPPQRITLLGGVPDQAHLAYYCEIDIALDPFPYNGTTTTCEALWMGVPVVTLRGDRHSGRVGASLLASVGLDELIAHDVNEYIDVAVRLAHDPSRLVHLRSSLRAQMAASPLCDAPGFAHKIESVYRSMWRHWCEKHYVV